MIVTVLNRQTLLDISLQGYGTPQAVFDLAMANDLSITDRLTPGRELTLHPSSYTDNEMLNLYKTGGIRPATGNLQLRESNRGIGTMQIESITNTFTVG